jgi:hypothetical protein
MLEGITEEAGDRLWWAIGKIGRRASALGIAGVRALNPYLRLTFPECRFDRTTYRPDQEHPLLSKVVGTVAYAMVGGSEFMVRASDAAHRFKTKHKGWRHR